MKITVYDARVAGIFSDVGICESDMPSVCGMLNRATQRLLFCKEIGEEGWEGSYARVLFNVTRSSPYITAPREVIRLSAMDICRTPIRVQNQWFEFLDFGVGLQKANCGTQGVCSNMQAYDRGFVPTRVDMPAGSILRTYWTNTGDDQTKIFFQGKDTNGNPIYSTFNGVPVNGVYAVINTGQTFVDTAYQFNELQNIAKDATMGPISLFAVDSQGNQTLLETFAPSQTTASYRRYLIQNLPKQCNDCDSSAGSVQVTALAQLAFVPVTNDSDFLIIGNLPALEHEIQAIRYEKMDSPNAKQQAVWHHKQAISYLNGELTATNGRKRPALDWKPFGRNGCRDNLQMV